MIKAFIAQVGGGRTLCSVAECLAQKDKKIAYVSCETSVNKIIKFADGFESKCKNFTIFSGHFSNPAQLYKKLEMLSEEYDLICIDALYVYKNIDYKKIEEICLDNIMNQCQEVWVTMQAKINFIPTLSLENIEEREKKMGNIKIKQLCQKIESRLMPDSVLVQSIDLETKEVKIHNLTNIFKN